MLLYRKILNRVRNIHFKKYFWLYLLPNYDSAELEYWLLLLTYFEIHYHNNNDALNTYNTMLHVLSRISPCYCQCHVIEGVGWIISLKIAGFLVQWFIFLWSKFVNIFPYFKHSLIFNFFWISYSIIWLVLSF